MRNRLITAGAFIRFLTLQKVWNYCLLVISFHISRLLRRPLLWGQPTTLSIEPTTSCNLRCPECPSGLRAFSRPTGMLQDLLFESIVLQSKASLTWLHLYFQGEPFLNPNFLKMVSFAHQNGIFTSTSTNAHYLDERRIEGILSAGLSQLIVSMDGITQEIYQEYRVGGHLENVQSGLKNLIIARQKANQIFPRIVLQFLVTGQNEHQLSALKTWAKEIMVDELQLKTIQIYDYEDGSPLIPSDLGYSRYKPVGNGKWKLKKKLGNKCWRMWQGAVITWDGKVVPCCFDKDASHKMGSLRQNSLHDIWQSVSYRNFRSQLLSDRQQPEICRNCTA